MCARFMVVGTAKDVEVDLDVWREERIGLGPRQRFLTWTASRDEDAQSLAQNPALVAICEFYGGYG